MLLLTCLLAKFWRNGTANIFQLPMLWSEVSAITSQLAMF